MAVVATLATEPENSAERKIDLTMPCALQAMCHAIAHSAGRRSLR
jgi:hypothetical protein